MRYMERFLVIALSMLVVLSLVVIADDSARYGGTVTIAVTANPTSADPHWTTQTSTRFFSVTLFEPLFGYDTTYQIKPVLVDTWERSEDGLSYTFHLRKGITFHNGKEMTAEDVKASLDRYREVGALRSSFDFVTSIDVLDTYVVKFTLDSPVTTLFSALANPQALPGILPREIVENCKTEILPEEAIGTGPYMLKTWKPDVEYRLVRHEAYEPDKRMEGSGLVGSKAAYFDEIVVIPQSEPGARMAGLETGLYDFIESAPTFSYQRLLDGEEVEPVVVKPSSSMVMELNHTNPPIDNLYFRQALLAAINAENVLDMVAMGVSEFYRLSPCLFFPEQEALWNDVGAPFYNQANIERAKELLEKANYDGEEVIFVSNQTYDTMYRATLAVIQDWIKAGINVKVQFQDWATQLDIMRSLKGYHIAQSGWSMRFDPTATESGLKVGGANSYGYPNPAIGELIDEYRLATTAEQKMEISKQINYIFFTDVPHIRIGDIFALWGIRSDIKNVSAWYIPLLFNVWREG